tara:strand:- start:596 stop:2188 length:1593 start_codon:yes stop_codon:yes gene_type:complete
MEFSRDQIEEIKRRTSRYKADPVIFIEECIKVAHPVRGLVPFKLYPFQKLIIHALQNNRFNILRKFRQAGCTTLAAAFSLWLTMFHKLKSVVILSIGDTEATEVLDRIKIMYNELPSWFREIPEFQTSKSNMHTFRLKNGSFIKSRPSGRQSGRGLSCSLLVLDEAAFIENIGTIWAAAYPTISTGGNAFVLSTVNGIGNWYHGTWEDAVAGKNSFSPLDINYKDHPQYVPNKEYDKLFREQYNVGFYDMLLDKGINVDEWEKQTKGNISPREWLQEYECSFLGTGDTYVDGEILSNLHEHSNSNYWRNYNNRMRVWKEAHPAYEYIVAVDISLGRERDYSAFHVVNCYNGEQVAEFYSNRTPINELARIVSDVARSYNEALVIPERNTIGLNFIDRLEQDEEYENLWLDEKGQIGFQMTATNKEHLLALMEEFIRTRRIKLNSERTTNELLTFVVKDSGKAEADEGCHDDLVISLALATFALKELVNTTPVEHKLGEYNEISPNAFQSNSANLDSYGGMVKEDLLWLLK